MSDDEERRKVVVVDIQMPFVSIVILMVKWAIAAIPALIIISLLGMLFTGLMSGFMGGSFSGSFSHM